MPKKVLISILIITFGLLIFNLFGTEKVEANSADNIWGWAWVSAGYWGLRLCR